MHCPEKRTQRTNVRFTKEKVNSIVNLFVKRCFQAFFIVCALLCLTIMVEAHSGRTDGAGGHNDNINGGYHYHHGEPAHQHKNGVCPYDYNDNVEHDYQTGESQDMPPFVIPIIVILVISIFVMFFVIRSKNKEIEEDYHKISELKDKLRDSEEAIKNKEMNCIAPYEKKIHNLSSQVTSLERQLKECNSKLAQEQLKIQNMEKAPNGITFAKDGMPIFWKESEDKPYGDYTVYCSTRHTYHVDRWCAGYSARKKHIFNVIGISTPCKKCAKEFFDFTEVPEWFKDGKQK